MCYDPGTLQAFLDQELDKNITREVQLHLASCAACRRTLARLENTTRLVDKCLQVYQLQANLSQTTQKNILKNYRKKGVFTMWRKYQKMAIAAVLVIGLASSLYSPGVLSAVGQFLSVFRVEKLQVININPEDLTQIEKVMQEKNGRVDIDQFGRVEVTGRREPVQVTRAQAQQTVDFALQLPETPPVGYQPPVLQQQAALRVNLTLNIKNINQLLSSLGSQEQLPTVLDGKTFSLEIPTVIAAQYPAQNQRNQLTIIQARSPELKVPEGVDDNTLRKALLNLPALPDSLRNQLGAIEDWRHTVPIPNIDGSSQEVAINGQPGVFIAPKQAEQQPGCLIWQQNGVVYLIQGHQLSLAQARDIVASMR